jgi:putative membrane protein
MSLHDLLKTAHIVALMVWIGTMFLTPLVAVGLADERPALQRYGAMAGKVMAFSLLTALGCGMATAAFAGWFGLPWVQAKLALAVVLAALHGVVSGQLRRLATDAAYRAPPWLGWLPPAMLALVVAAVFIAVAKPI